MKDDFTMNNIVKITKIFLPNDKVENIAPLGNGHIKIGRAHV